MLTSQNEYNDKEQKDEQGYEEQHSGANIKSRRTQSIKSGNSKAGSAANSGLNSQREPQLIGQGTGSAKSESMRNRLAAQLLTEQDGSGLRNPSKVTRMRSIASKQLSNDDSEFASLKGSRNGQQVEIGSERLGNMSSSQRQGTNLKESNFGEQWDAKDGSSKGSRQSKISKSQIGGQQKLVNDSDNKGYEDPSLLNADAEMMEDSEPPIESNLRKPSNVSKPTSKRVVHFKYLGDEESHEGRSLKSSTPLPNDGRYRGLGQIDLSNKKAPGEGTLEDDNREIDNINPGQSNQEKKGTIAGPVRFLGEKDSLSSSSQSGKSKKNATFSDLGSIGQAFSDDGVEDAIKQQFKRFYPVFRQVYRLRDLQDKGYKPKPADFFVAYLNGIQQADEKRQESSKNQDQDFYEKIRIIMEDQDRRTHELAQRLQDTMTDQKDLLESRLARVGKTMLTNYESIKAQKAREKAEQKAQAAQFMNYFSALGVRPPQ